jgi:hypothetical protein
LGIGGSREVIYRLRGPLPEGDYHLTVVGYQQSRDGVLSAEVLYRRMGGGGETMIMSVDGRAPAGTDPTYIDSTVHQAAIAASCHDELVVRVTAVSGSEPFIEIAISMSIP